MRECVKSNMHLYGWKRHIMRVHKNSFIGFFFFQAEDGIRDTSVTGVQTCALPILNSRRQISCMICDFENESVLRTKRARRWRSEERRVGKECRSRWEPDD